MGFSICLKKCLWLKLNIKKFFKTFLKLVFLIFWPRNMLGSRVEISPTHCCYIWIWTCAKWGWPICILSWSEARYNNNNANYILAIETRCLSPAGSKKPRRPLIFAILRGISQYHSFIMVIRSSIFNTFFFVEEALKLTLNSSVRRSQQILIIFLFFKKPIHQSDEGYLSSKNFNNKLTIKLEKSFNVSIT